MRAADRTTRPAATGSKLLEQQLLEQQLWGRQLLNQRSVDLELGAEDGDEQLAGPLD